MEGLPEAALRRLIPRLQSAISLWPVESRFTSDIEFNDWALEIHGAQRAAYPGLEAFWSRRAKGSPDHWSEIAPVPAAAFKAMGFGPANPEFVFRTSGTSSGPAGRGVHRVMSADLYKAAARANYRKSLFASGQTIRVLSLIPPPVGDPESSLARMALFISEEPEVSSVTWAFHPTGGVDVADVRGAAEGDDPLLVLTTAFALVQLLDSIEGDEWTLSPGSLVMETGGFKGRVASVGRESLYRRIQQVMGVPEDRIIGEYGMTELLSQSYDGLCGQAPPISERLHRFPPWVRTMVLDPQSLEPLPSGKRGLLAHYDLANAGSVCYVLTEDLGVATESGGFRLLGRASGADVRGCSLMAEAFLSAVKPVS